MSTINVLKTVITASDDGFSKTFAEATTSARQFNQMLKDGEALYKATRTPLENYEAELAKLDNLLSEGAISQETHNRAIANAGESYKKADPTFLTNAFSKMVPVFDPISLALKVLSAGFEMAKDAAMALADVLVTSVASGIERLDALDDAAAKIGVTTEALSALRFAAEYADVEAGTLDSAIGKMNVNIGKAADEGGKAAVAFQRLGLDAKTLREAGTEKAFGIIADAIKALPNNIDQARAAQDLFGKSGRELLPILREGAAGIKEWTDKGRELNVVMSDMDVLKAVQAADAMKDLAKAWEGVQNALAVELAPAITAVSKQFLDLGIAGGSIGEQVKFSVDVAINSLAALMNTIESLQRFSKGDIFNTSPLAGTKMLAELEKAREVAERRAFDALRERKKNQAGLPDLQAGNDGANEHGKSSIDDMQKRANELMDGLRTPVEKLQDSILDIEAMFAAGAIDVTTFTKAMEKAEADFEKLDDKEQKKIDDAQKKLDDKWFEDQAKKFEEADKLKDKLRKPKEIYDDEVKRLNEMFLQGWIDQETRDRGIKDAGKGLHHKGENRIDALEKGSKEAFTAINRARGGGVADKQLDVAKKQLEALNKLVEANFKKPDVVNF